MAREKTEAQKDRYSRYGAPLEWLAATTIGATSAAVTFVNLVRTKFHQDTEFRQGFSLLNIQKNESLRELTDKHLDQVMGLFEKEFGNEETFINFKKERINVNKLAQSLKANNFPEHNIGAKPSSAYDKAAHDFFEACQEKIDKLRNNKEFQGFREEFISKSKELKVLHDKKVDRYSENMFGIFSEGAKGHVTGSWQRFKAFSSYAQRNIFFKTAAALGVAFGGTMMVFNQLNTRDKLNEIDKQSERVDRKLDALLDKSGIEESDIMTRAEHRMRVRAREKEEDNLIRLKNRGGHVAKVKESREEAEASSSIAV